MSHMRGEDVLQEDPVRHPHLVNILLFPVKSFGPHPLNSEFIDLDDCFGHFLIHVTLLCDLRICLSDGALIVRG